MRPVFISSGDLRADARYERGRQYGAEGDLAAAADLFAQAVEIAPDFAAAWFALGAAREALGEREAAVAAFTRACLADRLDIAGAELHLARLTGKTPAMPHDYVRALFNSYAPDYDNALVRGLNYRAPDLLAEALAAACATLGREFRFARAFDLGCGTGLVGIVLSERIDSLTGIDLSPAMIEQARRGGHYNHLVVDDLMAFLRKQPVATADLIVAADSLPYVPDLAPLCREVGAVLESGGLFAFTAETHDGDGVILRETLRYAHGVAHVRGALAAAGLTPITIERVSCRTEKGVAVPGLLVVAVKRGGDGVPAEKPASTAPTSAATKAE
jgi:predicted TPR repeat methyltransferase